MPLDFHPFTKPTEREKVKLPQENNYYVPIKEKIITKKD